MSSEATHSDSQAEDDVGQQRFAFGENWSAFLNQLDAHRLNEAIRSLKSLLQLDSLEGKRFLDIGSGSGLFSLAAVSLGAQVVSVDIDEDSVACTRTLREQAYDWLTKTHEHHKSSNTNASQLSNRIKSWEIHSGSVLDEDWMGGLGDFDVVYSWGVLHHTGQMERAIQLASQRVVDGGLFAIAIYNDQGGGSRRWLAIKRGYHALPAILRPGYVALVAGWYETKFALARLARLRNPLPFADWRAKKSDRGMSPWHDWVDWVGGLPFEVASPEGIILPLRKEGFVLENLKTVGSGWGCNEYIFRRDERR